MNIQFKGIGPEVLDGLNTISGLNCDCLNSIEQYWEKFWSIVALHGFSKSSVRSLCDKIVTKSSPKEGPPATFIIEDEKVFFKTEHLVTINMTIEFNISISCHEDVGHKLDVNIEFSFKGCRENQEKRFIGETFVCPDYSTLAGQILSAIHFKTENHGLNVWVDGKEFSVIEAAHAFAQMKENLVKEDNVYRHEAASLVAAERSKTKDKESEET